jgi:hypothetical protein
MIAPATIRATAIIRRPGGEERGVCTGWSIYSTQQEAFFMLTLWRAGCPCRPKYTRSKGIRNFLDSRLAGCHAVMWGDMFITEEGVVLQCMSWPGLCFTIPHGFAIRIVAALGQAARIRWGTSRHWKAHHGKMADRLSRRLDVLLGILQRCPNQNG